MPVGERSLVTTLLALLHYTQKSEKLAVVIVDEYQDYGVVGWTPTFRKKLLYFHRRRVKGWYLSAKLRELRINETVIRGIVPFSGSEGHRCNSLGFLSGKFSDYDRLGCDTT
jgi:hypothetical protein